MFASLCNTPVTLLGVLMLGVLLGWILEWLFMCLFVPNPAKKAGAALEVCRQENRRLQDQVRELQAELLSTKATPAALQPDSPPEPQAPDTRAKVEPAAESSTQTVEAATDTVTDVPAGTTPDKDDLTKLSGIGNKIAQILQEGGIQNYAQLSAMDVESLNTLMAANGLRFGTSMTHSWPTQAGFAAKGDWEGLKTYQLSLKS